MDPAIECNGNKYKLNLAYACKTVQPSRASKYSERMLFTQFVLNSCSK